MSVLAMPQKSRFKPESADFLSAFLPQPLFDIQKKAQAQLMAQGVPTQKLESWNFSNLPLALKKLGKIQSAAPQISIDNIGFIRGLPDWALALLPICDSTEPSLRMMNYGLMQDAYVIDIPSNQILDTPIKIRWSLFDMAVAHITIRVQKNSSICLEEIYDGARGLQCGHIVIDLEDNARMVHTRIMNHDSDAVALNELNIRTARSAVYEGCIVNTGGAFSRTEIFGQIKGEGAEISLNGLQLQKNSQIADTTILIEHLAPHCRSHQFYKTILKESATGIFQGKIFVDQCAQKTDGYQMSNGILLSEGTTMQTKPQLEIYADDVKCSHGTTTGQLDETPLFYLCSRGLSKSEARRLLLQSACGDVIQKISNEDLRNKISLHVYEWLDGLYES